MGLNQQKFLDLFIVISGVVILLQFIPMINTITSITVIGLDTFSGETVFTLQALVIACSAFLTTDALLSLLPVQEGRSERSILRPLPFVSGSVLVTLGLASICLSRAVVGGTGNSLLLAGVELFSLGTLSLALFVEREGRASLIDGIPNYAYLLFFLAMLPTAALMRL
ncbi:MAG: hypothetical protein SA339_10610 [Methanomassiliicoccus sp.]|nr:hypothetical protein [Methanomassiliicoccus sp.]